jgi:diketogulonate reductase-like aldo/keto reductase
MPDRAPIPKLLYGTAWKEDRTQGLTELALSAGFRGIDTANQRKHYFEEAVGHAVCGAIKQGQLTRRDLFIQTKFTSRSGQDERLPYQEGASVSNQVRQSFESSLGHFGTDYLDSFVYHGPSTRGALQAEDVEAWRAIEALRSDGKVRYVGVSNFTAAQLRELMALARVAPRFVQNRCYAKTGWDREVRRLCAEHGVIYQGFSLLTANRRELERPEIEACSARTRRSTPELVFRFALQVGMLPLTGTSSLEHMKQDLGTLDFSLEPAEVQMIEHIAG